MSFLNIWALWIAAAVVPALLLLYFLKLRRRQEPVASTLLWKRAVQDLQVNAPFQRLRKNLLLFLQLGVLALAILALMRPIIQTSVADEERVVVLIDRSASMNTIEEDGKTRLELAKEQGVRLIRSLNKGTRGWSSLFSLAGAEAKTQVMVIAFADRATIVSPFTSNMAELESLVEEIEPTDAATSAAEAMELAEAYMAPPTMTTDKTPISAAAPARVVLISDGRVPDLDEQVLKGGQMEWRPIGSATDNVGIVSLRARRNYERPENVNVLMRVRNFGAATTETDVSLYVDGTLRTTQHVELGARTRGGANATTSAPATQPGAGDAVALSFDLKLTEAAVIHAKIVREDALDVDNYAAAVVPPARKLRVLVVTEQNSLLDAVFKGMPLQAHRFIRPTEWEANPEDDYEKDGQATFDVVIFDKYQPERLPAGNYLFIQTTPNLEGYASEGTEANHQLVWWDETHPIMRHVALEYVLVGESLKLQVPEQAEILIEGPAGPVLSRYAYDGRHCAVLGFAIENSNWWTKQSFGIFMYNVVRYLGAGGAEVERGPSRPGDTLRIALPAGAGEAKIVRPDGEEVTRSADAPGVVYYSGTDKVGIYRVENGKEGHDRYAVNLEPGGGTHGADDWENLIAIPKEVRIEGRLVQQVGAIRTATPEIWRWFVGAALVLCLVEWWIYNRRVAI